MRGFVIGGGLSGIGAALEISNYTDDITLIEKDPNILGLLSSFEVDGYMIPKFYHHVADERTRDFFKESGIWDKVAEKKVRFSFYIDKFNEFSELSKTKFLFFKPFKLYDKIKFAFLAFNLIFRNYDIKKLDKISAEEWLSKNTTENVTKFFGDLTESHRFPIPFSELSASWLYDRLKLEIGRFKSLGYPKGKKGWEIIGDYVQKKIQCIMTSTPVNKIVIEKGVVKSIVLPNETISINKDDIVVSSLPTPLISNVVKGLPNDLENKLNSIEYAANICVVIGIEEKLTDYYWINAIGNFPFGTIIDQNNLYGDGEFPWRVYYISTYCKKDDSILKLTDEQIFKYYMERFERIFKKKIRVLWYKVNRTLFGGAIEKKGFLDLIPTNDELHNLKFAGQYTTHPKERSTGETIMSGRKAVMKFFGEQKNES